MRYDRSLIASMLTHAARQGSTPYSTAAIKEQIRLLEEADNADAACVQTASQSAPSDGGGELLRYGRGPKESPYLLVPMDDGYWTPWHIAERRLATAGQGVDWRWQYRYQTMMRFMDAGADRPTAKKAADNDVASLERAAHNQEGQGSD